MRIDLSQLTSSQVASDHAKKVGDQPIGVSDLPAGTEDRTTFTSDSSSISALTSKVMSSPDIRQDLVEQLKNAIGSGLYKLDPHAIAASMIDEQA